VSTPTRLNATVLLDSKTLDKGFPVKEHPNCIQAGKQLNWIVGLTKLNLNLSIQSTQSHTPLHNQPTNRVIQLIDEIELIAFSF
jgi:hypothetical protein